MSDKPSPKRIKYLWDEMRGKHYVRAFKEQRDTVVQVWVNKTSPDGEPDGDWSMPSQLGLGTCIDQAILNTVNKG